jgi:hypothetical protein
MTDLDNDPTTEDVNMDGLSLDLRLLFLDINGIPKSTTDDMAALSIGLFMPDTAQPADKISTFPSGVTLYSGSNSEIPLDKFTRDSSAIEVSLSQENMSQLVSSLLNGSIVLNQALYIPTAVSTANIDKKMKIYFKKEGITFDFSTDKPLLIINDLRIEYLEVGVPKWMMSLDLAFKLDAGAHNAEIKENSKKDFGSYLDIYLTLVPEYAHCAILKDDRGIMMFDHSPTFVASLVDGLKAMLPSDNPAKGDLKLSILMGAKLEGKIAGKINTDDKEDYGFGMILSDASSFSDAGRCFLTMATEEASLGKSGLCFINIANLD